MLAPWKKSYDRPKQHIKKQRHHFANKGPFSQSYGFSSSHVWMWELNYKETESQRIDAFELWCWRRLLRVPWTARRSNQSILKEISPGCSLEGLMLKLKLQCFGHLMQRTDSLEKTWCWERLKAGGEGDDRRWDGWMASPTWWTWIWVSSRSWWWTGIPGVLQSNGSQRSGQDSETELNWPSLNLNADNFSDQLSIPGIQDKEYNFRLKEWDVYWKQNQGPRVLHWMPRNFYFHVADYHDILISEYFGFFDSCNFPLSFLQFSILTLIMDSTLSSLKNVHLLAVKLLKSHFLTRTTINPSNFLSSLTPLILFFIWFYSLFLIYPFLSKAF